MVLKHRTFAYLLLIFSPVSIFGMAFVSSSSYVYQETFGVSSQVFSYFFAIFAVGLAIGPVIYIRLSRTLEAHLHHHRLLRRDRARAESSSCS